jgi:hypothetical protein
MKETSRKNDSNGPKTSKSSAKFEAINQSLKEKEIETLKQFDLNYKYGPCYGRRIIFGFSQKFFKFFH